MLSSLGPGEGKDSGASRRRALAGGPRPWARCEIETSMNENKFPEGWNHERLQRVLAYYEQQNEDDAALEDDEASDAHGAEI
jgi:hypothetical protein